MSIFKKKFFFSFFIVFLISFISFFGFIENTYAQVMVATSDTPVSEIIAGAGLAPDFYYTITITNDSLNGNSFSYSQSKDMRTDEKGMGSAKFDLLKPGSAYKAEMRSLSSLIPEPISFKTEVSSAPNKMLDLTLAEEKLGTNNNYRWRIEAKSLGVTEDGLYVDFTLKDSSGKTIRKYSSSLKNHITTFTSFEEGSNDIEKAYILSPNTSYTLFARLNLTTDGKYFRDATFYKTTPPIPSTSQFQVQSKETNTLYKLLQPLPGFDDSIETDPKKPGGEGAFEKYFNNLIALVIGICALLAFIMIFVGGIEYMTSELVSGKQAGIEKLTHAILGLLLALGAFVILNTINPDLLNIRFNALPKTTIIVNDLPQTAINGKYCNQKYTAGEVWTGTKADIAPFKSIPGECTVVGQGSRDYPANTNKCTSLYDFSPAILKKLAGDNGICGTSSCTTSRNDLIMTGGTECWLHSTNSTHGKNSSTVDIQPTKAVNQYIAGKNDFPKDNEKYPVKNTGITCVAETAGATNATTGDHWHCYGG